MLSIVAKTTYALCDGKEYKTDFIWTSVREVEESIILFNKDTVAIFSRLSGKQELYIDGIDDVQICNYFVIIGKENKYGCYTFSGKEIVPIEFDDIGLAIYNNETNELIAIQVEKGFEYGGYYIVKSKTFYEAEEINITKTGRIELLMEQEWVMLE